MCCVRIVLLCIVLRRGGFRSRNKICGVFGFGGVFVAADIFVELRIRVFIIVCRRCMERVEVELWLLDLLDCLGGFNKKCRNGVLGGIGGVRFMRGGM